MRLSCLHDLAALIQRHRSNPFERIVDYWKIASVGRPSFKKSAEVESENVIMYQETVGRDKDFNIKHSVSQY
ncbi:hypothetical protein MANI_110264 [Metarhizium anisopliae]|nr:hypothetical protein MANI_110264 [Metarhizium anisopliae]